MSKFQVEAKKIYDRNRYLENKELIKKRVKLWREKNLEKVRMVNKQYYSDNKEAISIKLKTYSKRPEVIAQRRKRVNADHLNLKIDTFIHYSGGVWPFCNCCKEDSLDFLTLDHINNDGAKHRKENGLKGAKIYYWLKARDYPVGFQVLCWNCNASKGLFGECPHKELVI